jgi:DNA-binding GntR family transcriptional regulator
MHIKDRLAQTLRDEIVTGCLAPGERIVENKWAARQGVAQASVREAINILAAEGFVHKDSGQSARVTLLTEDDVRQIYQLRANLESFAAKLLTERLCDLTEFEQILADMRSAIECRNIAAYYERDLRFHLLICERSGNRFAAQALKALIVPLFAFYVMRIRPKDDTPARWATSLNEHWQMVQAFRSGDPALAAQVVSRIISGFRDETRDLV